MVVDNSLSLQFTYLDRETAAIDLKEVGKLLAVKGYIKLSFADLFGIEIKISEKLLSRGAA